MDALGRTALTKDRTLTTREGRTRAGTLLSVFCVGLYAGGFGPALAFFARGTGVSLDTAGLLLTAVFGGSILTSFCVATRLHGRDPRRLALLGLAAIAAGTATIGLSSEWAVVLVCAAVIGTGDGLAVSAGHTIAARAYENVAHGVSRLNQSFAIGAMIGPLWAGVLLQTTGELSLVFGGIAFVALLAAAILLSAGRMEPAPERASEPVRTPPLPLPMMAILGALLFLYVGAEIGLGSWLSAYAEEAAGASVIGGAAITSGYWAALFLGRLVSGWRFNHGLHPRTALGLSITGALVSSLVIAISGEAIAVAAAAAFVTGFCFGPIWPATLALTSEGGNAAASAAMVTIGNAGGLFLPWFQGRVLVANGPGAGVAISAILCALMLALLLSSRLVPGRRPALAAESPAG